MNEAIFKLQSIIFDLFVIGAFNLVMRQLVTLYRKELKHDRRNVIQEDFFTLDIACAGIMLLTTWITFK